MSKDLNLELLFPLRAAAGLTSPSEQPANTHKTVRAINALVSTVICGFMISSSGISSVCSWGSAP